MKSCRHFWQEVNSRCTKPSSQDLLSWCCYRKNSRRPFQNTNWCNWSGFTLQFNIFSRRQVPIFGRLDKWFSVEQGCVVDLLQFSGNSVWYEQPAFTGKGKYFYVSTRSYNLCECWPCQNKQCITDLLALWALLEIDDTADMTCTFPQLPDTVSKIKMPLGKPASKLLEFLGIDPKLYEVSKDNIPYDPSSCDCCFRLTKVTKSDKEPSLTAVRQLVLEVYPRLFVEQVWNFDSGKPFLHDWWSQNEEFEIITYTLYTSQKQRDALRWCAGFRKSWSVSNMAVMNAVYALMLFSDHINL